MADVRLENEEATMRFGAELLSMTQSGLVYLKGELGVGKTTVVRGLLRELGYHGKVKSPTYTLVETYALDSMVIQHFDLYRLSDPREFLYLGAYELLAEATLSLVEWPERGEGYLPPPDLTIDLSFADSGRAALVTLRDD